MTARLSAHAPEQCRNNTKATLVLFPHEHDNIRPKRAMFCLKKTHSPVLESGMSAKVSKNGWLDVCVRIWWCADECWVVSKDASHLHTSPSRTWLAMRTTFRT